MASSQRNARNLQLSAQALTELRLFDGDPACKLRARVGGFIALNWAYSSSASSDWASNLGNYSLEASY